MKKDEYKKEIGRRIAKARTEKNWSLEDLKTRSGIGRTTISNYEAGSRMPGPCEINALAKALGASAAYLMCLDEAPPNAPPWLDRRIEKLPDMFKEAIRLKVERYIEIAERMPVSTFIILSMPTSRNIEKWERGIEAHYKSIVGESAPVESESSPLEIYRIDNEGEEDATQRTTEQRNPDHRIPK